MEEPASPKSPTLPKRSSSSYSKTVNSKKRKENDSFLVEDDSMQSVHDAKKKKSASFEEDMVIFEEKVQLRPSLTDTIISNSNNSLQSTEQDKIVELYRTVYNMISYEDKKKFKKSVIDLCVQYLKQHEE